MDENKEKGEDTIIDKVCFVKGRHVGRTQHRKILEELGL
jgi:hypothetical protein